MGVALKLDFLSPLEYFFQRRSLGVCGRRHSEKGDQGRYDIPAVIDPAMVSFIYATEKDYPILHSSGTPPIQSSSTPSLQHSTTPPLQYSNIPIRLKFT